MKGRARFQAETGELHIRIGTPEDIDAAMELALLASDENALSKPSPEKLLQEVWAALSCKDGICGIIGDVGKPLEAMVVILIGTQSYSDEPILEERVIYVRPEFRSAKGGRAARLCEFSKRASDYLGIPLTIGVLSNERTEAKIRMYRRILGEPSGAYWIYNGKTGSHSVTHDG